MPCDLPTGFGCAQIPRGKRDKCDSGHQVLGKLFMDLSCSVKLSLTLKDIDYERTKSDCWNNLIPANK